MNITITGATGFVGSRLVRALLGDGHSLHALGRTRSAELPAVVQFSEWRATQDEPPPGSLRNAGAVIHLVGEPVAQRWTAETKRRIRASRVEGTRKLVSALSKQPQPPQVLVSASAIGYYGDRGDEILTESSGPGDDFLARVAVEWEQAAQAAESFAVRVVPLRFGIVLGAGGGALAKMLPPFRLGLGGPLASGRQWMSWIHIDDLIGLIRFALENPAVRGPMNATVPQPATNSQFTRELAAVLHRPAVLPVPRFALKLLFGEMAEAILASQRVLPQAAQLAGFQFQYPQLGPALARLLSEGS